uniref:BRD4 interacting chromatin remodeling complex associated protein n=1 Tax=Strigops habroptila TaxID=2489341 RepID=A0A672UKD8_STRHB
PLQIDSDDLLDNTGDAASSFFEGAGVRTSMDTGWWTWVEGISLCFELNVFSLLPSQLHVQESSGNHLSTEQNQPAASVDLDFLEDDILGSPSSTGANLPNSDQPCDILQQSLQEANITEQTLEAEAELDLGSFQLPTLQPVVQATSDGTPQIFSGGADLIGLQQPTVLTHQALVQQSVGADVVNKAISVQPFLQQVGLGNVTIQPISNLQGLPNGSPSGTLGIGPIQVVGQQVMAINQSAQQIIAKQQVTLASTGVSPQGAGLVIQKNLPTVATTTLNGNSMFGSVAGTQGSQPLTVTSNLSSPLVQAQNVIIHRTPTPIQPKPAGVLQQKLYQITPKPFGSNNTTLTIQNEAALQQQKAQQNLTFMASKPGQNVVLSGFPQGLPANVFKQPPPQQQALSKPMSVHLLNQGSSIVIPAQHVPQAMLQGQNQFLLPGQLAGASTVQLPQQLSALQANMGGQILTTSHPGGQAHIITSQGPGGQLLTNQALPAQLLTNQNITSQLNLGQVLTSQSAHGTAHILSAPIQLQAGQPSPLQDGQPHVLSLSPEDAPSIPQPGFVLGIAPWAGPCPWNCLSSMRFSWSHLFILSMFLWIPLVHGSHFGIDSPNPNPGLLSPCGIPNESSGVGRARGPDIGSSSHPAFPCVADGRPMDLKPQRSNPAKKLGESFAVGFPCPVLLETPGIPPVDLSALPIPSSFLEQLHKHQGSVLHPDYKTAFRSFNDALQRLLPYHVYQGMLPSAHDYRKVDEEFEVVSTQLLKRTQAMLNKYRLLLLEESRRVSPSAEMVMIDRMFIQEEKTTLALDKQLAKEKPGGIHVIPSPFSFHWELGRGRSYGEPAAFPARTELLTLLFPFQTSTSPPHPSRLEESSKLLVPAKPEDSTSGLMKELAEVEEDFYHGMIKPEPPDQSSGPELHWEAPFPAAKRRKSESLEVDNASFSSDSPQDDALNEHLQSAIDSILNLQQHPGASQSIRTPSSSYNSSSSPFSSPVHRTDTFVAAPNHNGGLGARTLTR